MRVVSLLPSATEIVCALGHGDRLVGVSHECDHPDEVVGLPVLSAAKIDPRASGARIDRDVRALVRDGLSVYRVDAELLESLRADLVVTQDHCEVCAVSLPDVEAALCSVSGPQARVCSLHPGNLGDVVKDFRAVAEAVGDVVAGERLVADFERRMARIRRRTGAIARSAWPSVALVEWLTPAMVAGGWMPELAHVAGGRPVLVTEPERFLEVDWSRILEADPDVIVLLPCGFGVDRTLRELGDPEVASALGSTRAFREGRAWAVDGNSYFNRPTPRLVESAEILAAIFHPGTSAAEASGSGRLGRSMHRLTPASLGLSGEPRAAGPHSLA